jgi:hypothetical protein
LAQLLHNMHLSLSHEKWRLQGGMGEGICKDFLGRVSEGAEASKCTGWSAQIQMDKVLLAAHMIALTHIWMVWDVMVRVGRGAS